MLANVKSRTTLLSAAVLFFCAVQLTGVSLKNPHIPRIGSTAVSAVLFPLQRVWHEATASAQYMWSRYVWLIGIYDEVTVLRGRVRQLEALNSRYVEYRHENQRLKDLVHFSETTGYRGVSATVVGRSSTNWVKTLTIDKGSADGLRPGLPVIDGNAVVGQTTVVTARSTKILLLSDPASSVDALIQSSRLGGIVEGGGDGRLRMRYVEQTPEESIALGDRVVASGLDQVYPKGVAIGVVHQVTAGSSALFKEIIVEPSAVFSRIETVLVLLPELQEQRSFIDELFQSATSLDSLPSSLREAPLCSRMSGRL